VHGYAVKKNKKNYNNVIFVTCIYDGYHGTPFGGRPDREKYYRESLKSISNIGYPIYCFTSSDTFHQICNEFKEYNNIFVIKKDLTDFWFSNSIFQIKIEKSDPYLKSRFWIDRNCHIMWGKTEMIRHVMNSVNITVDYLFWIDAGLSSSLLFPHEYFHDVKNNPNKSVGIFNKNLIQNILNDIENKIISICHTIPNNRPLPKRFYHIDTNMRTDSMIGGFFGGRKEFMDIFCCLCVSKIVDIINDKELFSEESIYSTISHENKNLFKTIMFDSFYHRDWGHLHNPNKVAFSDYFEKFIKNEKT
jgi:hypothetical protein